MTTGNQPPEGPAEVDTDLIGEGAANVLPGNNDNSRVEDNTLPGVGDTVLPGQNSQDAQNENAVLDEPGLLVDDLIDEGHPVEGDPLAGEVP
ncbi:hypothetical protein [Kribbella deserti]|uniref:Sugar ABC transporter ATPase n=1 Tax=Kribbella deserti TaxID=1926257 RepID=A0ABV6QTK2_9ACTN